MNIITRRSFLGSLALGSIYANVEQPSALQSQETEEEKEQTGEILWSIARQHRDPTRLMLIFGASRCAKSHMQINCL
jgi:hypothetical protein